MLREHVLNPAEVERHFSKVIRLTEGRRHGGESGRERGGATGTERDRVFVRDHQRGLAN